MVTWLIAYLMSLFTKLCKLVLGCKSWNALAYTAHEFFQENGFVWISRPIITASDCEEGGEHFCMTTLVWFVA